MHGLCTWDILWMTFFFSQTPDSGSSLGVAKIGVLGRRRLCMNQTASHSTSNLFGASQSQSVSSHAGPIASNNMFLVHLLVTERGSISSGTRAHMNTCIYKYIHICIYI